MSEVIVRGLFNSDACNDCPVQETCHGRIFAELVGSVVEENVQPVALRFKEATDQLSAHLNEGGRQRALEEYRIASRRFEGLLHESEQAQNLITAVVTVAAMAQNAHDADQRLHNLEIALESILEDKSLVLPKVIDTKRLDAIGKDVWENSKKGVCSAIEIFDDQEP